MKLLVVVVMLLMLLLVVRCYLILQLKLAVINFAATSRCLPCSLRDRAIPNAKLDLCLRLLVEDAAEGAGEDLWRLDFTARV